MQWCASNIRRGFRSLPRCQRTVPVLESGLIARPPSAPQDPAFKHSHLDHKRLRPLPGVVTSIYSYSLSIRRVKSYYEQDHTASNASRERCESRLLFGAPTDVQMQHIDVKGLRYRARVQVSCRWLHSDLWPHLGLICNQCGTAAAWGKVTGGTGINRCVTNEWVPLMVSMAVQVGGNWFYSLLKKTWFFSARSRLLS